MKEVRQHPAKLTEGRGERVLVVEDEEAARQGLHEILVSLGYNGRVGRQRRRGGVASRRSVHSTSFSPISCCPGWRGRSSPRAQGPLAGVEGHPDVRVHGGRGRRRRDVGGGTVRFLQKPFDMATLAREILIALAE